MSVSESVVVHAYRVVHVAPLTEYLNIYYKSITYYSDKLIAERIYKINLVKSEWAVQTRKMILKVECIIIVREMLFILIVF